MGFYRKLHYHGARGILLGFSHVDYVIIQKQIEVGKHYVRSENRKSARKLWYVKMFRSRNIPVAARLRSLRTNDPLNKGHPRSIEKEIELCQTYFRNYQTNHIIQ